MNKYAVLLGGNDIKVTRILTDEEVKNLSESDRVLYEKDCSIGKKFHSGRMVEARDPYCALLEAREIDRLEFE